MLVSFMAGCQADSKGRPADRWDSDRLLIKIFMEFNKATVYSIQEMSLKHSKSLQPYKCIVIPTIQYYCS